MVEISTNLTGDTSAGLDKYEAKIKGAVLISGVAAMARVLYEELLLNTSPPRMGMKTGTLHSAVYRAYSPESSTDSQKVYHVSVNKRKAPHWALLEYGTSRMAARPYIRPAFDRVGDAIKAGQTRMRERLEGGT